MSETAKCPICKEMPLVLHTDSYGRCGVGCCGHTIWSKDNPREWNKYATATELARVTARDCTDIVRTRARAAYIKAHR